MDQDTRIARINARMMHPSMDVDSQFFKIINQDSHSDLRAEMRKINSVR